MIDNKPTYDIADRLVGKFVQPIVVGDIAKRFHARDECGRQLDSLDDHLSGKHLVMIFLNNPAIEAAERLLRNFAENWQNFRNNDATVLAVSSCSNAEANQALKRASGFQWPILGDPSGIIHAKYGMHKNHGEATRLIVVTPYRQIKCWYDNPSTPAQTINTIMTQITTPSLRDNEAWYPAHAPVLIIPKVLTREECSMVVAIFQTRGDFHAAKSATTDIDSDFKLPVYEHDRQDRVDHVIRDAATTQFLDKSIGERVNPIIKKAFAFDVTRRENFHIARYVGKRNGIQMGHRDNASPASAYRRFAFSMNLNADYEGGGIVFSEFSKHAYRTEPGTVLIFSSSLLHEVQETTRGIRYSLITHLFNESAVQK